MYWHELAVYANKMPLGFAMHLVTHKHLTR